MRLADVYETDSALPLYELLEDRPEEANISHREMPTWDEHISFIESRPYEAWYLIVGEVPDILGTVYLTKNDEIGISLFSRYRGAGLAKGAISLLMEKHPRDRYLANINPRNAHSIRMFESMGFRHIQNTYEYA